MDKKTSYIGFIITAVMAASLSGGGVYLLMQNQPVKIVADTSSGAQSFVSASVQPVKTTLETTSMEVTSSESIPYNITVIQGDLGARYELDTLPTNQQILYKNDDQEKKKVIIADIQKQFPELNNYGVSFISNFDNKIVFVTYLPESDGGFIDYYSLDTKSLNLKKMKVNDIYNGSFNPTADNLMGKVAYAVKDEKEGVEKLYVLDLRDDSYKVVATLDSKESFDAGSGGFMAFSNIEWIGDNKIRFAVFDASKKDSFDFENPYKSLLEYREVTIK